MKFRREIGGRLSVEVDDSLCIIVRKASSWPFQDDEIFTVTNVDALVTALHDAKSAVYQAESRDL